MRILSPSELSALLAADPTARVVDVRTPAEFETAHLRGAYNVPLDTLGEHGREIAAVRAPVILVCQSGQRARRAEEALRQSGHPHLHVLDGGVNGWLAAGFPVVRGRQRISLERQVRIAAGAIAATGAALALTVHPWFAGIPLFIGSGLVFAGVTDSCLLGTLLAKLPYNRRAATCDVATMVRALRDGAAPAA